MNSEETRQWRALLEKSWSPSDWSGRVESSHDAEDGDEEGGWRAMWVYRRTEPGLWTVGFYAPDGSWNPDSDHSDREEAAERVHYLNGGE